MLQALIKKGRVLAEKVPAPMVSYGSVLIKVAYSCISAGTEIAGLRASGTPLIKRAIQQPDKIMKAMKMIMTQGIAQTVAKAKGDEGIGKPTGYSLSGIVLATGEGIDDLKPGDRVAAAGVGIANHAEFVDVPRNLVLRLPEGLDLKRASTVALGGIAMQGVRRAQIQLGDFVVVFGTGILGLLTVEMVRAAGGRCIAVDLEPRCLDLAKQFGAELTIDPSKEFEPVRPVMHLTGGHGADTVIFTAATSNPDALSQALGMTRKKGRLVMVGVYGKQVNRDDLYKKEIDLLISTSYGPGRYDENYEQKGLDYPYAYVRWTENRNMAEYLRLMAVGALDVNQLIEAVYPIEKVAEAFASLNAADRPLMVLLDYGEPKDKFGSLIDILRRIRMPSVKPVSHDGKVRVGLIGAGNFARSMHLPNLKKLGDKYQLLSVCNRTGSTAKSVATKFRAQYATTDYREILQDPDIDLVMICTRHNKHGGMVLESLQAGKHTFVEKPLCTTQKELDAIKEFYGLFSNTQPSTSARHPFLMVGFNRRFSRYAREAKKYTDKRINPLFIHYRMSAGYLPLDHWVHGAEGGGRIVGEACHIIDLFSFFTESRLRSITTAKLSPKTERLTSSDNKIIVLEYEDGSVATLEYFAVGSRDYPKEYMEIHFDERTIVIDDYRSIKGYGLKLTEMKTSKSEKGQLEELVELYQYLQGAKNQGPIPIDDLIQTTEISFAIANQNSNYLDK